jgi:hypothetical protein
MTTIDAAVTPAGPFTSIEDAQHLMRCLVQVMDALLATLAEETASVRAGRLREANALAARKAELAGLYVAGAARIKANAGFVSARLPDLAAALRQRHEAFQAALAHSMAVLATVHAVAEGLIRGAAEQAARRTAPQTYGASGKAVIPNAYAAQPIAVARLS